MHQMVIKWPIFTLGLNDTMITNLKYELWTFKKVAEDHSNFVKKNIRMIVSNLTNFSISFFRKIQFSNIFLSISMLNFELLLSPLDISGIRIWTIDNLYFLRTLVSWFYSSSSKGFETFSLYISDDVFINCKIILCSTEFSTVLEKKILKHCPIYSI